MADKILSIDCDFFMKPCINLYNHLVKSGDSNFTHDYTWKNIFDELDCERFMSHDEENFNFMLSVIDGLKCPIYVGLDHHSILKAIDLTYQKTNNEFCGPFDIVNIDHHHDIAYKPQDVRDVFNFDCVSCGDWVSYLEYHDLLNSYYWICNNNSKPYDTSLGALRNRPNKLVLIDKEDYTHKPDQFGLCYISSSLEWIPPTQLEIYFKFIRRLIDKYGDNVQWFNQPYESHLLMTIIKDGLNNITPERIEQVDESEECY